MLARSRPLNLDASGLASPLIIPSVSSKGFPVRDGISQSGEILKFVSPDLPDALLVSAYDLAHKLMPDVDELLGGNHRTTVYGSARLLVVDSGGYELNSESFESGETHRSPYTPMAFSRADYERILQRLPVDRDVLVVSYDEPLEDRPDYRTQRQEAQSLLGLLRFKKTFLLKPEHRYPYLHVPTMVGDATNLRAFDVLGVTEKELGDTIMDRLLCLARIRGMLDGSGCGHMPIHVFGSIDPLMTPLYFMAGAEIFDGLSWLRYAYRDDLAVHPDELAVLDFDLDARSERRDALRYMANLRALRNIRNRLVRWVGEPGRFDHLGTRHLAIQEVYETMCARLAQEG